MSWISSCLCLVPGLICTVCRGDPEWERGVCASLLAEKYCCAGQFSTLERKCSLAPPCPTVAVGHGSARSHPVCLAASTAKLHLFIQSQHCCQSLGFIQQYLLLCAANSGSLAALWHTNCASAEEKFSLNRKEEVTSCFCLPLTANYGTAYCLPQLFPPRYQWFSYSLPQFWYVSPQVDYVQPSTGIPWIVFSIRGIVKIIIACYSIWTL